MFHKENPKKQSIVLILFLVVIVVGLFKLRRPTLDYELSTNEIMDEILMLQGDITPEETKEIINLEEPGYQFIDIRNPFEYEKGYIGDAINIPVNRILEKDFITLLRTFMQDSVIVVLYGTNQVDANCPWMILKQLGFENIQILLGGYTYYKSGIDEAETPEKEGYYLENLKYDIPAIIAGRGSNLLDNTAMPNDKQILSVRKKKKSVTGGGC